jgi:hypothetical protein
MYRLENFFGAADTANAAAPSRSIRQRGGRGRAKKIRARGADFVDLA